MVGTEKKEIKTKDSGSFSHQDPLQIAPDMYKVVFENDTLRIVDINLKKNQHSPMHSHPNYFLYSYTPCKVRFTSPDGYAENADIKAGDVQWRDAESHRVDNLGDSDCHVLNIEFKKTGHMVH